MRLRTAAYVSGGVHGGVMLWVAIGGWFTPEPEPPDFSVAEVSIISPAAFDALISAPPAEPGDRPPRPWSIR